MEEFAYRYQASSKDHVTVRLSGDQLIHSSSAGRHKVPLAEVMEVNLASPRPEEYTCRIKTRSGRWLMVVNRSFKGFGRFQPHNAEYLEFILSLHRALEGRTDVRFSAGIPFLYYFMLGGSILISAGLVTFLGLLAWALLAGKNVTVNIIGAVASVILLIPFASWTLARRPREYEPDKPPMQWLPVE